LALQAKILRFLQERVIERIGGREEISVDVRVICATHRDLQALIAEGKFREDLYYRISEIVIPIPPLREREGDTMLLARALLDRFRREQGRGALRGFSNDALSAIEHYPWPGNVRELENKIKRAVIMAEGTKITAEDLDIAVNPKAAKSCSTCARCAKRRSAKPCSARWRFATTTWQKRPNSSVLPPDHVRPHDPTGVQVISVMSIPLRTWRAIALVCAMLALVSCAVEKSDAEHVQQGHAFYDQNQWRAAIIEYKNALQLNPQNADARRALGLIYLELGNGVEAEKELRRAVDPAKADPMLATLLARALLLQNQFEKVLAEFPPAPDAPATGLRNSMVCAPKRWPCRASWNRHRR